MTEVLKHAKLNPAQYIAAIRAGTAFREELMAELEHEHDHYKLLRNSSIPVKYDDLKRIAIEKYKNISLRIFEIDRNKPDIKHFVEKYFPKSLSFDDFNEKPLLRP